MVRFLLAVLEILSGCSNAVVLRADSNDFLKRKATSLTLNTPAGPGDGDARPALLLSAASGPAGMQQGDRRRAGLHLQGTRGNSRPRCRPRAFSSARGSPPG